LAVTNNEQSIMLIDVALEKVLDELSSNNIWLI
jgi:hypothetical protein